MEYLKRIKYDHLGIQLYHESMTDDSHSIKIEETLETLSHIKDMSSHIFTV